MLRLLFLLLCCLVCLAPVRAQQNTPTQPATSPAKVKAVLVVLQTNEADANTLRKYNYKTLLPDSLSALQTLRDLTLQLQNDGYLTASADSFSFKGDTLRVQYFVGDRYRWAYLRNGSINDEFLTQAGYREKLYPNTPFSPREWTNLQETVLTLAENNGYPFATIRLDSVQINNGEIAGVVHLDKDNLFLFDTLHIEGSSRTTTRFLSKYLQIYPGQPYSQQKVARVNQLLQQLPYVKVVQPLQVQFTENKAYLYLFIDEKKANQLDGIVGFLPNPNTQASNRKFLINGEVNLQIRNIRGSGKQLGLQWRKVQQASQTLDAHYLHPNILGSPFELGLTFNLYKQDSTFLTLRPRAQLSYYTTNGNKVSFFSEARSSRLLLSTPSILNQKDTLADSRYQAYGINFQRQTLDDLFFPHRGYLADVQLAVGNKTILRNPAFEAAYYDTIRLKSTQLTGAWQLANYFKLAKNSVLLTRLQGEMLFNPNMYRNDLFRLGGLTSLRGFSDFVFYASAYAVGTLEYRLYTAADSYVLLFYDQGYYRRDLRQDHTQQYPFGLGGGISFSTGAGIFQFIYSVGRSKEINQPISLNFSRIHFGIVSRF
ncbi:MAG: hypothetical protein COW65_07945 [Cytophagales bacterium CG18_big_fil_WC_8_21_14_2_50_42_9]|nr:MAG: hypothetical protein COW65_07945 [Cytophagales bacterium CG18_big_fil_WC_8_21_14_2_50_42_9]